MSDIEITVPAGKAKRLLVSGKRHTRNIVVTATGGESYEDGWHDGYSDGLQEGYQHGWDGGYDEGWYDGDNYGYNQGLSEGRQDAYDAFWDAFQENGNRTNYRYAFYSQNNNVWDDKLYNPKYPITAIGNYGGDSMYQNAPLTDTKVDIEIGGNASYTFISCYSLKTIRKLIVSENTIFYRWFDGCEALESVTFEGVIANDISFRDSLKLSNASVQSIIDHLKDFTGQTGKTLTLHAYVGRELTEAQKTAISAKNWTLVY